MIEIPTLEELRETRRRLAEACGFDVHAYGEMLRQTERPAGMKVISRPFVHRSDPPTALVEPLSEGQLVDSPDPVP